MQSQNILPDSLPDGFKLPSEYLALVSKTELPDVEPWWWLKEMPADLARFWIDTLKKQFPGRALVPFAKMEQTDDLACFDGSDRSGNPRVLYIHAYTTPGWELRGEDPSFAEWLRKAEQSTADAKAAIDEDEED